MPWIAPSLLLLTASAQPVATSQVDWRWDRDTPSCALRQTVSEGIVVSISRTPGNDQTSVSLGGEQETYKNGKSGLFGGGAKRLPRKIWVSIEG